MAQVSWSDSTKQGMAAKPRRIVLKPREGSIAMTRGGVLSLELKLITCAGPTRVRFLFNPAGSTSVAPHASQAPRKLEGFKTHAHPVRVRGRKTRGRKLKT